MEYYDKKLRRLVICGQQPNADFWDRLWLSETAQSVVPAGAGNTLVKSITAAHLAPGSKILEGGCGVGQIVYGLRAWGYRAYGVDFASKTVERTKNLFPDLNITVDDVSDLHFPDSFFDGYWSFGVIEHFINGFEKVIREMKRVVRANGFVFITFPCFSPLRKIKAYFHAYPQWRDTAAPAFYEYVFDDQEVITRFYKYGFRVIDRRHLDATKGFKDESKALHALFQTIYRSRAWGARAFKRTFDLIMNGFSPHISLLVFRNENDSAQITTGDGRNQEYI